MTAPLRRKFPWWIYWVCLFLIFAVMFAPVGSVRLCGILANALGCRVDEGSVHPCVINGSDYGHLLYTLGVAGWLMLLTLPAGALALVVWLVVLITHRTTWQKRQLAVAPPAASAGPAPGLE